MLTRGGSSFNNLEGAAADLQEMLGEDHSDELGSYDWELWQANTLDDRNGINGVILIYRRPLPSA